MTTAINNAVFAVVLIALAGRLTHRISTNTFYALCITAQTVNIVMAVLDREAVWASVMAGGLAITLWLWWNDGGGDDTKRRLKKWAQTFKGVRRSAPVTT